MKNTIINEIIYGLSLYNGGNCDVLLNLRFLFSVVILKPFKFYSDVEQLKF